MNLKKLSAPQIMVGGFLLLLVTGGLLLMLPIATQSGESTNFWDAFFTATSALNVTGQITLETASHWNYFGKTVIITLIEFGGLGFMTIILLFFFLIGKKVNLRQQRIVQESLNLDDLTQIKSIVKYVLSFSILIQLIGAAILSIDFIPKMGVVKGIYFSIFHSISAFCNAGFDLFGDSMASFRENPLVLITIMSLIVIGGLGFIVWRDLLTFKSNKKLLLHTRIVVKSTLILLISGFVLLFISESMNGTFDGLNPINKAINVMFMSVTPRTAGFSNVDYRHVSLAGLFLTFLLMFIGGSSGSTAGGIKVTTLSVFVLTVIAYFKRTDVHYQERSIGVDRIRKATIIILLGLVVVVTAIFLLFLTQTLPEGFGSEAILMEVFSCFGTVGLSMGLTPYLNWFGKLILMILMFMGRVGLLTIFLSIGKRDKDTHVHYPEGSILVG